MLKKFFKIGNIGVPSLFILILMVSIGPFGDTEYAPSLPRIAHDLGVRYDWVQLTMTSYLAGYAISQILYGPLSDKYGRKPLMLLGAFIFVIGSAICLASFSIWQLIGGRFIQALGSCAGAVLSSAAVRDSYPPEQREHVFAKINAAFALAPALGPVVGTLIDEHFGWHANFLTLLILSAILFISVWIWLPETNKSRISNAMSPHHFFHNYWQLFKDPYYLGFLLVMGCCIGIVYCSLIGSPALVINVLHLSQIWILWIAMSVLAGFVIGSLACNFLTLFFNDRWVIFWGLSIILVSAIAYEIFAYSGLVGKTILVTLGPVSVMFAGIAFVIPVATAGALEPFEHIAGSASAMIGFFQMGVASIATGCLGLFPHASIYSMPHMFLLLSFVAIFIYSFLVLARSGKKRMFI